MGTVVGKMRGMPVALLGEKEIDLMVLDRGGDCGTTCACQFNVVGYRKDGTRAVVGSIPVGLLGIRRSVVGA